MKRTTLLLSLLYLVLFWLAVAYAAFGQSDTTHVSGVILNPDGKTPAVGVAVYSLRSVRSGSVITSQTVESKTGAGGVLHMTLPRNSVTYLYCPLIPSLNNPRGVAVTIPDASTATLAGLVPATPVPSGYVVAVPGCSDVVLAQISDSLDALVRAERDPAYLADQGGIYSGIAGAQQTADQALQAAQEAGQNAQQAQNSANDAYQYFEQVHQEAEAAQSAAESANASALLAMDTAKSRTTPGEVRAAIRDSLERVPRVEADPVYTGEKAGLFAKADTAKLHAQVLQIILNILAGRRDSTTINGVKGVSFTVPTIADSTMPYAFVGGAMTLYRGTRFGVLSLSTAAPDWRASGTTVFGLGAGSASTTGTNNTILGNSAANALTSGYENTFLGSRAGIRNKTGYGHTGVGDQTLYSAWDGANVTALGSQAGYYHAHGSGAIYIGRNSGPAVQDTGITYDYSIALGTNARPTRSNQMVVGGAGAGIDTTHLGNGVWNSTPTSVIIKSTNPLPNDGGSTPGGNITLMAGSAGSVRSGSVRIVTSGQQRLAVDSTGTLEGNSQMRGTTTIGAGDSVQVSVPGATPTDVVMATYNIGKTAVAAGDTILSCKIWAVGTLTIYGVASRKVSWLRIK